MIHRISHDDKFLLDALDKLLKVDDFSKNLYNIYQIVMKEGLSQELNLGIFRSDYMMHQTDDKIELKQVEINTIAAGFGGLSPKIHKVHKYILSKYSSITNIDDHLPKTESDILMVNGLIKAWDIYNEPTAIILFVVEERAVNICDQKTFEFNIGILRPDIKVVRRSFKDLRSSLKLNNDKRLMVGTYEVAVVYYRMGYDPRNYNGEQDWQLRLDIERSKAIKCPSIRYHLSGIKKIQQLLADRSLLEKFIPDQKESDQVFQTFAGLWGLELGKDSAEKAIESVYKNPKNFVLKPPREGGGNNYYADDTEHDIIKKLDEIRNSEERESYILMEFLRQPQIPNYILVPNRSINENNFKPVNVVSELGIFGVIIGTSNEIVCDYEAGHVLRSKMSGVHEGGIAAGFGAVDSPFLF